MIGVECRDDEALEINHSNVPSPDPCMSRRKSQVARCDQQLYEYFLFHALDEVIGLGSWRLLQPGALLGEFRLLLQRYNEALGCVFSVAPAEDLQSPTILVTPSYTRCQRIKGRRFIHD
jgi:hypothetical protein